jgi:prepilin-type N-terminal cleavage/methylation domain-containing protein
MQRRNHRGFTLLELIVVLIIMGLMSAVVIPRLVGPMSNLDLKTASQKISASLRYVRSRAASEKRAYVALFDFDNNRLVITHFTIPPSVKGDFHINDREAYDRMLAEPPNDEKDRPNELKTYNLPDGIKLAKGVSREGDFNSGFFRILFFPSGGSSGGEITVASERGRQYKINVDFITGNVQLLEVVG